MPDNVSLGELEFAGNMKFRFLDVTEDSYSNGTGISLVPNDANLNRIQTVIANVDEADLVANYEEDNDVIRVYDGTAGTELADESSVDLTVTVVGK